MGETKITAKQSDGVTARITSIKGIPVNIEAQEIEIPSGPLRGNTKKQPVIHPLSVWTEQPKPVGDKSAHRPTFYITPEPDWKDIDLDGDGIPENFTHTELVAIHAKSQCPAAMQLTDSNKNPDIAINTSSFSIPLSDLREMSKLPLNNNNLSKYKNKLAPLFSEINDDYNNYNRFTKKGIPVFASAGNSPNTVNPEAFAEGVTSVGGLEPNPHKGWRLERVKEWTNNDLVDKYASSTYPVKVIRNANGKTLGLNITNRNNVDIPVSKLSTKGKFKTTTIEWGASHESIEVVKNLPVLRGGTSVATPEAATEHLRKRFGTACDLPQSTSP